MSKVMQIPGATLSEQPAKTYRLRAIKARVQASESVVDLLAELAFGPPREWTPAGSPAASFAEVHARG